MTSSSLQALVATLAGKRVLIVGDVMLDEYLWGDAARLSAEAPVPVVEIRRRTCAPGGAGNVAANVVGLGGAALMGGCVGADSAGARLKRSLAKHRVDCAGLVALRERPTTTKTRLVAQGQQIVRMDAECRLHMSPGAEQMVCRWIERHVPEVDACILSDYGKGVVSERVAGTLIGTARRLGRPVVVDPKGTHYARYRGATVIKPNHHEVERVLREEIADDNQLVDAGGRLVAMLDGCAVLITRGAAGMALFRPSAAPRHVPAVARHVFDVTGAGDTVIAVLALALATGAALEDAVIAANLAAGIAVGKRGTATVTTAELRHAARQYDRSTMEGARHARRGVASEGHWGRR